MELGLFVEPQMGGSYVRLVKLAKWAEDFGLDAFARSDHYLHMERSDAATDALVSLAGVAGETSTIRLVTLVSPITFRHPAVMAKSATTLDEISEGRFTLGVGAGWMESEHEAFGMPLPPLAERFARLEESLAYIRTVFSGGGTTTGEYYSFDHQDIRPAASNGLRIVVGGGGPKKTPRLAGTFADEYNMFAAPREVLDQRIDVMRNSAVAAGRDPGDILISYHGPSFVHSAEAPYRRDLQERAARTNRTASEYSDFLDERSIPHGTPERAHQAIEQLASWGVDRFYHQDITPLYDLEIDRLEAIFGSLKDA